MKKTYRVECSMNMREYYIESYTEFDAQAVAAKQYQQDMDIPDEAKYQIETLAHQVVSE